MESYTNTYISPFQICLLHRSSRVFSLFSCSNYALYWVIYLCENKFCPVFWLKKATAQASVTNNVFFLMLCMLQWKFGSNSSALLFFALIEIKSKRQRIWCYKEIVDATNLCFLWQRVINTGEFLLNSLSEEYSSKKWKTKNP